MKILFRHFAALVFLAALSNLAFAACTAANPTTDCNVMSITVSTDANEYTVGNDSLVTITVNVKGNSTSSPAISTVTISLERIRPGFELTPTSIFSGDVTLTSHAGTASAQIPVNPLQPGLQLVKVNVSAVNGQTKFYDSETSDNYATTYFVVKKTSTTVPETNPLLAVAAAAGVIFIIGRAKR